VLKLLGEETAVFCCCLCCYYVSPLDVHMFQLVGYILSWCVLCWVACFRSAKHTTRENTTQMKHSCTSTVGGLYFLLMCVVLSVLFSISKKHNRREYNSNWNTHVHRRDLYIKNRRQQFPRPIILTSDVDRIGWNMQWQTFNKFYRTYCCTWDCKKLISTNIKQDNFPFSNWHCASLWNTV
jgi:hypothetical protein